MTADVILSRIDGVRQTGPGKWLARCPAHDDRSPSLSVRETDDGKLLVYCFAGCGVQDITAAIGLELSDLFPPNPPSFDRPPKPPPRFRASEVLPLVVTEAYIMRLALGDLMAGRDLSPADRRRVEQAMTSIARAHSEVMR